MDRSQVSYRYGEYMLASLNNGEESLVWYAVLNGLGYVGDRTASVVAIPNCNEEEGRNKVRKERKKERKVEEGRAVQGRAGQGRAGPLAVYR